MVNLTALTKAWAVSGQPNNYSLEQLANYCEKEEIVILDESCSEYPQLLREIADPPKVIYVKGSVNFNVQPMIAVVGTRRITPYGQLAAREFTQGLVEAGFAIVSGFMYGVDAVAHSSALEAGGRTIGVLGFGLEHMYPTSHRELASKLLASGNSLITEFPPWMRPFPTNFPRRNRIVSGMSLGTLVIEAASKSGSKITARLAAEQGREVFAVPGVFNSVYSEGTKELINLGAKLVTSVNDILDEL